MRFGIAVGMVVLALSGPAHATGGVMVVGIAMMVMGGGMMEQRATEGLQGAPSQPGAPSQESGGRDPGGASVAGRTGTAPPAPRAGVGAAEEAGCNH